MSNLAPPPLQIPAQFATNPSLAKFFAGLLNTIYQLWSTTYNLRINATVKTEGATVAGLLQITVPTDKTLMIEANIVARRTGGSAGSNGDSAWYKLQGAYKNINGTLTGVGSPSLTGGEDQAGWNVGFSASGEVVTITTLGAANNNITWEGAVNVITVGA